jgi:hypothetical protein
VLQYPKLDISWVKTLFGYEYDDFFIQMSILLAHLLYPSGIVAVGMFSLVPYSLPGGNPLTYDVGSD